ncbi:antitoxin HicB [Mesorhizobium sp. 131-3-5]|uniref:type II toxin-antitoxin system HicB family antitoxin n=1 Tax=Mesorhizobium sp. 131-3-5 TaxID=2744520 RepID=UPI00192865CA|nr:type II toxin-antitoxin system HicB family antitoxin [Mesorhizobium sp. 131-3-5]BCH11953.1 antitoxin HicB [Mesorhizobium sp. 131-3-5]
MKGMIYKGFGARIEFDSGDEIFSGKIAGISDVIGFHADTVAGLKTAFHEAVDDYVETCKKVGKEPQKPYSGNLMLRVDPRVHSAVAIAAELAGKSLNEWGEEVLAKAARANDNYEEGRFLAT